MSTCYTFPDNESFCDTYIRAFKNEDKALAKETCQIARRWFAGRNVVLCDMNPKLIIMDLKEYECKKDKYSDKCKLTKRFTDAENKAIRRTLWNIVEQRDCKTL